MPGRRHCALLTKLSANRSPDSRRAVADELRRVSLEGCAPPGSPIPVNEVATSREHHRRLNTVVATVPPDTGLVSQG
jgi:hypothetical protein